jgi:hypothetical protein
MSSSIIAQASAQVTTQTSSTVPQANLPGNIATYHAVVPLPLAAVRDDMITTSSHVSPSNDIRKFKLIIHNTRIPDLPKSHQKCDPAPLILQGSTIHHQTISYADSRRNICAQEWCAKNPGGSTAAFKQYYEALPANEKEARNKS